MNKPLLFQDGTIVKNPFFFKYSILVFLATFKYVEYNGSIHFSKNNIKNIFIIASKKGGIRYAALATP